MNRDHVQKLLGDARVLARHAARNGQLPPDSRAMALVAALETNPPANEETRLSAELYAELDLLAKAIRPVRIVQLTWHQTAIVGLRRVLAGATPFVIGFFTLLLTLYLAFQSSQLHQADTALRSYYEWTAQQPREKLYAAFKMYRYEKVLNVKAPPLAQLDAYQKIVEDAHQLAAKGEAIQGLLATSSYLLYVPRFMEHIGPEGMQAFFRRLNAGDVAAAVPTDLKEGKDLPDAFSYAGPQVGRAVAAGPERGAASASGSDPSVARRVCDEEIAPPPVPAQRSRSLGLRTVVKAAAPNASAEILSYETSWSCFLQRVRIPEQQLSYSAWPVIFDTKLKINLLVTWLLPGLYGLLGACVYLLRDMVINRHERAAADRSVLNSLSLVLRIAVGGLAGIVIGWFWVPGAVGAGPSVPEISAIPFGMAFLAGFSIETLFSILDRLNRTIENREPRKA